MTDNVSITEGSGDKVIATDDVGGVQYQIVKLGYGDDGAATVVSTGASAVPIKDGGNSITVDFTTASKAVVDDLTTASLVRVQSTGGFAVTMTTASQIIADVSTSSILVDINSASSAAADSLAAIEAGVIEPGIAGTPSLDVLTVQGSTAGMTPLLVTATTASKIQVETTAALAVTLTTASKVLTQFSSESKAQVEGGVAHDAADSGNPIKIGAAASTGLSGVTLVTTADRTNLYAGLDGALYVRPHCGLEDLVKGTTTISASTVAVTCLASVASIKQYVTHVSATNTSTVNAVVGLIDATTPAIMSWACPANYSGFISNFAVPLAPAAAGTKWALQTDTSLATVICNMAGFKSKI
jgi:hypothetical protein